MDYVRKIYDMVPYFDRVQKFHRFRCFSRLIADAK